MIQSILHNQKKIKKGLAFKGFYHVFAAGDRFKERMLRPTETRRHESSDRFQHVSGQTGESIRASGALRALYDNCGEDEELAIRLDKAIRARKQDGFRNNPVKENRIKQELYKVLGDEDEVERIYKLAVEQEEY